MRIMGRHLIRLFTIFVILIVASNGFSKNVIVDYKIENWNHWVTKRPPKVKESIFCDRVRIFGSEYISFNSNEKIMICGDPKVVAWNYIPDNQVEYNIKNFLQDKGYFYPEFGEDENSRITVNLNEKTFVSDVTLTGEVPPSLKIRKKRGLIGSLLTPSFLSSMETWIESQLQDAGYPCADVASKADARTGIITFDIKSCDPKVFPDIERLPADNLNMPVLGRYDAFRPGWAFNQRLLNLTTRRIQKDGIAQSSYFIPKCGKNGDFTIQEKAVAGKPRLFIFGIGADTEEYVKGKITWKQSRLGKMGSSLLFETMASYRRQHFKSEAKWYLLPKPSRWYLKPRVKFERRHERLYDYIILDAGLTPTVSWDSPNVKYLLTFGPKFIYNRTYKGRVPGLTHFMTGMFKFRMMSHNYEYFDYDPRTGFDLNFQGSFSSEKVLASASIQQIEAYGEGLWNVMELDPPFLIMGLRGMVGTSITNRSGRNFGKVPPRFLYYLGGSQDVRGFKRQSLPPNYQGALTAAYLGAEARFTKILPLDFQPLLFIDAGIMGNSSLNFDYPLYWSPGFGVRWPSLVGIFRLTFARGLIANPNNIPGVGSDRWQFFFSYGEEF